MLQRSCRGGSRVMAAGVGLMMALLPVAAPGQYARYIDAYNTLARAANERAAACGVGAGAPLRTVGRGETFNTAGPGGAAFKSCKCSSRALWLSRTVSIWMPGSRPTPSRWRCGRDANGDAIGRHLMEGVGDGKGRLTRVPATTWPVGSRCTPAPPGSIRRYGCISRSWERFWIACVTPWFRMGRISAGAIPTTRAASVTGGPAAATWPATRDARLGLLPERRDESRHRAPPTACMYGQGPRQGLATLPTSTAGGPAIASQASTPG